MPVIIIMHAIYCWVISLMVKMIWGIKVLIEEHHMPLEDRIRIIVLIIICILSVCLRCLVIFIYILITYKKK